MRYLVATEVRTLRDIDKLISGIAGICLYNDGDNLSLCGPISDDDIRKLSRYIEKKNEIEKRGPGSPKEQGLETLSIKQTNIEDVYRYIEDGILEHLTDLKRFEVHFHHIDSDQRYLLSELQRIKELVSNYHNKRSVGEGKEQSASLRPGDECIKNIRVWRAIELGVGHKALEDGFRLAIRPKEQNGYLDNYEEDDSLKKGLLLGVKTLSTKKIESLKTEMGKNTEIAIFGYDKLENLSIIGIPITDTFKVKISNSGCIDSVTRRRRIYSRIKAK